MIDHEDAKHALNRLLWELPAEFSDEPGTDKRHSRSQFSVIKQSNVHKVHQALWDLQEYFNDERQNGYE